MHLFKVAKENGLGVTNIKDFTLAKEICVCVCQHRSNNKLINTDLKWHPKQDGD